MWFIFALLSAVIAARTSIPAKIGISGVDSNLVTAIRTVVVVIMAWGMAFLTGAQNGIGSISRQSWIFLILSGLATGGSWLSYYKALQIGEASKVVPIDKLSLANTLLLAAFFLRESPVSKICCQRLSDCRGDFGHGAVIFSIRFIGGLLSLIMP